MRLSLEPPLEDSLVRALASLLGERRPACSSRPDAGGAWRDAALHEGVDRSESEPGYALSPRSTRGATRA